jgi:hypothetical protein
MARAKQTFYLGTAVRISDVLSVSNPDTVKITIEDPVETVKVDDATMTESTPIIYSYIYQSDEDDEEGDYVVTITATKGDYSSVVKTVFTLIE